MSALEDRDWVTAPTRGIYLWRTLNGWKLSASRGSTDDHWFVRATTHDQERVEPEVEGLANALIIAEGFATDDLTMPPDVDAKVRAGIAEKLSRGAA